MTPPFCHLETGSSDKEAVDIRARGKLSSVGALHGPSVDNADALKRAQSTHHSVSQNKKLHTGANATWTGVSIARCTKIVTNYLLHAARVTHDKNITTNKNKKAAGLRKNDKKTAVH